MHRALGAALVTVTLLVPACTSKTPSGPTDSILIVRVTNPTGEIGDAGYPDPAELVAGKAVGTKECAAWDVGQNGNGLPALTEVHLRLAPRNLGPAEQAISSSVPDGTTYTVAPLARLQMLSMTAPPTVGVRTTPCYAK